MYLLTRPLPKLAASKRAFEEQSVAVTGIATTDIRMLCDTEPKLEAALAALNPDDAIVVTSTFAANALCNLASSRNVQAKVVAVGSSTADLLNDNGIPASAPISEDSVGVLAMPVLQQAKNRRVLIVKGEGGRTLIRETLEKRRALVQEIAVYRRITLTQPKETNHWQWEDVKGIIVTSQEMAAPLFTYYDKDKLASVPWLTVSARIRNFLSLQGIEQVAITNGANDQALIKWVKENWE